MFSRHDGSGFGRRLRRAALAFAVPIVFLALAVGHYRACAAACRIARPNLADADAQRIVDFMKASVRTSARYFWGTAALGAALLFVALRMARRQAELGDEMEGLVRNTLHRLSHSLSAIREEAGGIRRRQGRLGARPRDGEGDRRVSLRREGLAELRARQRLDVHSHIPAQLLKRFRFMDSNL